MAPGAFYIELPPDASEALELAGRELAHYVGAALGWEEVVAGADLPDRSGPPSRNSTKGPHAGGPLQQEKAYRLRLGTRRTSFIFRSFLNQVMKALGDDGFRIVADETTTTFCAETDKGALNAVYSFLANVLRVKWVEPGPIGEVLPRREVRPWWPMDVVETPAFPIRGMHVAGNARWYREQDVRLHLEWMARNRLNHLIVYSNCSYERLRAVLVEECRRRGVTLEVEALSFDQFLPMSLFEGHPEYFPVVGGERAGRPLVQRCASSREAVALFVRNCVQWVREHPEAEVVSLTSNGPSDGDGASPLVPMGLGVPEGGSRRVGCGWCECDSCRSMKPNEQWSKFLCPALAALRTEFPRRQFAARACRGRYDPLETDAECRLGVALMFDTSIRCPWHELGSQSCDLPTPDGDLHDVSKGRTANVYLLNVLKEWKSVATAPAYVFESVAQHGLVSTPVVNPEAFTRDMITYRSLALDGVVVLGHVHSFGSYVLNFNLFARLAWDLEANYRGLWPDLCVKYFGGYSFRVLDFVERLRERGEGKFTGAEWESLEALLAPAFEGESDVFTRRYRRLRESFLYMRELARLEEAGERLRRSRSAGDRAAALDAARAAHRSFLDAWDIVARNSGSGMFDTLDVLTEFITRGTNAESLAEEKEPVPLSSRLEAEGLSIDDIHARVEGELAAWRDRFAALAPRLEELIDDIDFGFGRPR